MDRGILYLAVSVPEYAVLAHFSIRSLRECGVLEPIHVLTDFETDLFDLEGVTVSWVKVPAHGYKPSRYIKTRLDQHTPFSTTLFLDCDVVCLGGIDSIWQVEGDPCLALDVRPTVAACDHSTVSEKEYSLSVCPKQRQWNTGVILWRDAERVWELWHEEWLRFLNIDQLALARALHRLNVRPTALPPQLNHQGSTIAQARDCGAALWHPWQDRFAYHRERHGGEFDAVYHRWCQLRPS